MTWNVVDLVPNQPPSERNREDGPRWSAIERMRRQFDRLLTDSAIFVNAPFKSFGIVVGIDRSKPKPPWLGRIRTKDKRLPAFIEFDWCEIRDFKSDEWFAALVPLVYDAILKAAKKYKLRSELFERLYEDWKKIGFRE